MKKKILFMRDPLVNTYTPYGALFSIMHDNTWPWIYNNFIQIRYAHSWKMYTFDEHDFLLSHCPTLNYYIIPQNLIISKWNRSMKQLIIDSINSNNYLFLFIDRYYIPKSDCYMETHFPHQIFVFGYDLEKNIVHIADNLHLGKFIKTECTFEDFENAYWNVCGDYTFLTDVRFLELKEESSVECNCCLDIEQILLGLDSYLNSKRIIKVLNEQNFDYGFNSLDRLFDLLESENADNNNYVDIRPFHLFYEHKLIMEKRVAYMLQNDIFVDRYDLSKDFSILKNKYYTLRNLVIKYNLKKDSKLMLNIIKKFQENVTIEKKLIEELIECLDET